MANLPVLLSLADDLDRLAISPFYTEPAVPRLWQQWPSWSQLNRLNKELATQSPIGKDGFQVSFDVSQFKPSELNVKVVDNSVIVEGKHEERQDDHGYISRHFKRRYTLPKGYEPDKVTSTLSSDGVLTVSAPKPQAIEDKSAGRQVQIQQTGPAHLNVKHNPQEEAGAAGDKQKKK